MQKQPLLILLLSFILGILVQEFLCLPVKVLYVLLVFCILAIPIFFVKNIILLRFKNIIYVFISFTLGIFLHFIQNRVPDLPKLEKEETIIFKLDKKLKTNDKNKKYEVIVWKSKDDKIPDKRSFKSVLILPRSQPELDFLHFYQATGFVSKIEPPQNDYQFNYQKYLQRKGIFHQIYLPKGFKQSARGSLNFFEKIKQQRLDLLKKIDETEISVDTKELIKGIILADRTEMNGVTVMAFQKTGLVHILAISGTHIAIIFGLFYFVFIKIFPFRWRRYAIVSSIIFIWIFAVFIGLGNSVVRACIMLSVYFTYIILQRRSDFLHSISFAAAIILLFNVDQIFDVGFQLSFCAVFGIFWFNQTILKWFPTRQNKVLKLFKNIFAVTTSAQLGTLPLVLYYFHQYSFLSIFANLVILPLVEILIIGGLFVTILISIGIHFSGIFNLFDFFVSCVLQVIHWLSSFDLFFFNRIALNFIELVLLFIFLYYLKFIWKKFDLKNLLNLSYILIVFIAVRLGFHFYYQQKNEVVEHQYYKRSIISNKQKDKIIFYIKEDTDQNKISEFVISPYLIAMRTEKFEIVKIPRSVDSILINKVKFKVK